MRMAVSSRSNHCLAHGVTVLFFQCQLAVDDVMGGGMLLAIALLLCWCADYEFVRCKRDEYDRALGRAGKMSAGVDEGKMHL